LVVKGLVDVDYEGHGALKLNSSCRPLLRGETKIMFRKDLEKTKGKKAKKSQGEFAKHTDNVLWDTLRTKRRELADAQDVPPYIIFSDATLTEMVERAPTNHHQFAQLSGVGERKLELYADEFLAVIANLKQVLEQKTDFTETVEETITLFKVGFSAEKITLQRELKSSTIFCHLAQGIEQGIIELKDVIDLSDQEIKVIQDEILNLPEAQSESLKPVFEALAEQYSYDELRCVKASM